MTTVTNIDLFFACLLLLDVIPNISDKTGGQQLFWTTFVIEWQQVARGWLSLGKTQWVKVNSNKTFPRCIRKPQLVYDWNHYFGLGQIPKLKPKMADTFGRYHDRYQNHIAKEGSKGQLISKCFLGSSISSKKQTNEFDFTTMIPQVDLFLFVFWRKSTTQKNHFEINWPLVTRKYAALLWRLFVPDDTKNARSSMISPHCGNKRLDGCFSLHPLHYSLSKNAENMYFIISTSLNSNWGLDWYIYYRYGLQLGTFFRPPYYLGV